MPQGPNYGAQGGSVWTIGASGTLAVASAGSVQVASGGVIAIASGGSVRVASGGAIDIASGGSLTGNGVSLTAPVFNIITLGGTLGKWAFGTTGFTGGVGTLATGLGTVKAFTGNPILGEASGLGSISSFQIDLSLANTGSVIFRGVAGTLTPNLGGTISWSAFGY